MIKLFGELSRILPRTPPKTPQRTLPGILTKKQKPLFFAIFAFAFVLGCQGPVKRISSVVEPATRSQLPSEEELISYSEIQPENLGYILFDPKTKKALKEHNADSVFIPSSVSKIISAVAALKILGANHRFETSVWYTGIIKNKTLHGNLYLYGTGDPFLTASDLMQIAIKIRRKGIRKITGALIYDESRLPSRPAIDLTDDASESYNSGISALSSEFNQSLITWKPVEDFENNSLGLEVFETPKNENLKFSLGEEIQNASSPIRFESKDGFEETWSLSPHLVLEGNTRIPTKTPGYFTASLFKTLLGFNEVEVQGVKKGQRSAKAKLITVHQSEPVLKLVSRAMEWSNNLMAELLFLSAAKALKPKIKHYDEAGPVIEKWIKSQIENVPSKSFWKGFHFSKGSGLGAENKVSPRQLAAILDYADQQNAPFVSLLPISGWKGTLNRRLDEHDTSFRVWAKTGTQSYSSALAGYLFTAPVPTSTKDFVETSEIKLRRSSSANPVLTKLSHKLIFVILNSKNPKRAPGSPNNSDLDNNDDWVSRTRELQDLLTTKWIMQD